MATRAVQTRKVVMSAALEQHLDEVIQMLESGVIKKHAIIYVTNLQKAIRMSFENGTDRTESRLDIWNALRNEHKRQPNFMENREYSYSAILNHAKTWSEYFYHFNYNYFKYKYPS
jgi:hypothetical protein